MEFAPFISLTELITGNTFGLGVKRGSTAIIGVRYLD